MFSSGSPKGVAQTLHRCVLLLLAWEPRPRRCLVISCLKRRFCQTCGMTRLHVRKMEHSIHLIHLIAFRVIGQLAHTFHESLCQVFAGTRESWLPFWNLHGGGTWLTQASAFRRYFALVPPPPSQRHGQPSAHGSRGFPRSCGMGADLYRAGLPDDGRSCGGTALPLLSSLTTFCGCRLLRMWTSEVSDFSMVAWSGTQTSSTP